MIGCGITLTGIRVLLGNLPLKSPRVPSKFDPERGVPLNLAGLASRNETR